MSKTEGSAEAAGAHPPAFMYVCEAGSQAARYECFEPPIAMDQPPFEDHMFADFPKDRHVQVVVGSVGELQFRDDLPVFANDKRKEEPLLLQSVEAQSSHPPPPPPQPSKKSEKKKSDNNGIKKKKTR